MAAMKLALLLLFLCACTADAGGSQHETSEVASQTRTKTSSRRGGWKKLKLKLSEKVQKVKRDKLGPITPVATANQVSEVQNTEVADNPDERNGGGIPDPEVQNTEGADNPDERNGRGIPDPVSWGGHFKDWWWAYGLAVAVSVGVVFWLCKSNQPVAEQADNAEELVTNEDDDETVTGAVNGFEGCLPDGNDRSALGDVEMQASNR